MTQGLIDDLLKREAVRSVADSRDFYFQKGQDALKKWLENGKYEELKNELLDLSKNYHSFQKEAEKNDSIKNISELLFEIISYCDSRAKDKHVYNQYDDKRSVAMASVRMDDWIRHLILYKFSREKLGEGSTKNAFNYLLDPENNTTILSQNHRELISEKVLKKPFNSLEFVNDLKEYFSLYSISCLTSQNYTHLLSKIVYAIQDEWREEVVALMASDGTGWQDDYIKDVKTHEAGILWNSKKPTGTDKTIGLLRNIVREGSTFNLYYCSGGQVNYKITVIDFAEDQKGLDKKSWGSAYKNIKGFQIKFSDYADSNKQAKIVFLISSFEKINPIPVSKFKFYKDFQVPRQDNLSPVKFEPEATSINESETKETKQIVMNENKWFLNQILFGPPGTGKTYTTINKALAIVEKKREEEIRKEDRKLLKKRFDSYVETGQIVFTTFHQSMSYEDFIEGIKPLKPGQEDTFVRYEVESGIFKKICQNAKTPNLNGFAVAYESLKKELATIDYLILKTPTGKEFSISLNSNDNLTLHTGPNKEKQGTLTKENIQKQINGEEKFKGWEGYFKGVVEHLTAKYHYSKSENKGDKNYVLIIDEINRGNVSQIFGELITLIEEDKRLGKEEALEVTLPYSKDKFGVPSNVYIIGTMNTADRSVEALDAALRRRFSFEEMPPKPELIAADGTLKEQEGILEGIDLAELLKVMNRRIEKLLDKDHQIGHSYFMSVSSLEELKAAFQNKIIPLLQEYFFGDYGKIGLVLGKGFVKKQEWKKKEISFADFAYENSGEFEERDIYELIDYTKKDLSFTFETKTGEVKMDFIKAIKLLLNQEIG